MSVERWSELIVGFVLTPYDLEKLGLSRKEDTPASFVTKYNEDTGEPYKRLVRGETRQLFSCGGRVFEEDELDDFAMALAGVINLPDVSVEVSGGFADGDPWLVITPPADFFAFANDLGVEVRLPDLPKLVPWAERVEHILEMLGWVPHMPRFVITSRHLES